MTLQASSQEQLRRIVDQIERLETEKQGLSEDIRDKFVEAKSIGFDVKVLRKILKMRKQDKTTLEEEQAILDTYMHALGMFDLDGKPTYDFSAAKHGVAN